MTTSLRAPLSVQITRILSVIAVLVPLSWGVGCFLWGAVFRTDRGGDAGPASPPDLGGVASLAGTCIGLGWSLPLLVACIMVWRRSYSGCVLLAVICGGQAILQAVMLVDTEKVMRSPALTSYTVFLFVVLGAAIPAAVRLARSSRPGQGFPVVAAEDSKATPKAHPK